MLLLFAALFATASFSEASSECSEIHESVCAHHLRSPEFPITVDELDASCESLIDYIRCVKQNEENCEADADMLQEINRFLSFLERACNKETSLYRVVADNLVCIREEVFETECNLNVRDEEELKKFEGQLKQEGITITAVEEYGVLACTNKLYFLACRAARVGKECGEDAKDAVTEIFQHVLYTVKTCSEETIDEFPTIVRVLQAEISEEEKLEEVIKK